jgi:16S rRNA (adenine1518-N6/adenine1519-N6)-dimethyltransferase
MVAYLKVHYPQLGERLFAADFLQLDLDTIAPEGASVGFVGNFPYNISSQIVIKAIDHRHRVPELVGMFQKEVAERIVAPPGNKVYGILSVLTQAYFTGEYLFTVDKGAFNPPPKVQSGVIRLIRKDDYDIGCDDAAFRNVVKTAFGQRRKMLRNTMRQLLSHKPEILEDTFFNQRPEQLKVSDFIDLTKLIAR